MCCWLQSVYLVKCFWINSVSMFEVFWGFQKISCCLLSWNEIEGLLFFLYRLGLQLKWIFFKLKIASCAPSYNWFSVNYSIFRLQYNKHRNLNLIYFLFSLEYKLLHLIYYKLIRRCLAYLWYHQSFIIYFLP